METIANLPGQLLADWFAGKALVVSRVVGLELPAVVSRFIEEHRLTETHREVLPSVAPGPGVVTSKRLTMEGGPTEVIIYGLRSAEVQ